MRRPASRQSSAVTSDGTDSTVHAPSAQSTETSITHVTRIAFDACRAAPLPFAHRKRLPKARKLAERTHLEGDKIVSQIGRRPRGCRGDGCRSRTM